MRQEAELSEMEKIKAAAAHIQQQVPVTVEIGIILGTGLGQLVDSIEVEEVIPYEEIPFFPVSTVESHSGKLIFGRLEGKYVLAMQGRFHYYEGYSMQQVTFPVRVMKLLGLKYLLVSNAAGGLNPGFQVGELMLISDHIDLFPENPLRGKNIDEMGPRFPDMSEPYAEALQQKAHAIAQAAGITLHSGVYVGVQGPNLETKAEYHYLRVIGADAVGMSTIPEVIVANQMGVKVMALSAITDLCSPGNIKKVEIAEVLAAAAKAEPGMTTLMRGLVKEL